MHRRKGLATFGPVVGLVFVLAATPALAQQGLNRRGPATKKAQQGRRPFATAETPKQTERLRMFDVQHIKGELTLDTKASEIRGAVTHTITPLFPALASVTLDCASSLKVSKVEAGLKGSDALKECKFEHKIDTLVITLERPFKTDETFDLKVTYSGSPKKGIYFIAADDETPDQPVCVWTQGESEETRHWLPCYDHPNERATSEMIVTVAKPLSVLSNGSLVDTKENGDTVTYHWKMELPHSSYLISLAASEFNVVHDKVGSLPVDYYVLKTVDEATTRRAMGKTPRMIDFFQERIGQPYPYAKYAQVVVPEFTNGGMENISATTLNDYIIRDATSYLEFESDSLIAHELAHQWFGDLLTCREWSHIWLNEGFASYFDALYTEYDKGDDAFRLKMAGEQRSYMGSDRSIRRAIVETRYRDPDQLFESVTYAKGASVVHALRGLIGDDAWWRGIKGYVAANKLQVVDTDDFKKAMEKASGKDLGWFFDQWVYHAGHPELKASWKYESEDQTVRVKVEQTQTVDDQTPLFRLPTAVEIADESGLRTVAVVVDGKTHEFVIPNRSKPKSVRLDPKGWWTKELEFERAPEEWVFLLEHAGDALGRLEAARAVRKRENDSKAIEALSKACARETDVQARAELVGLLAAAGGEKVRPALADAAKDKDARVRTAAFRALANLKADDGAEALFRAALGDSKEAYGVRRAALGALAKWKVKDRAELLAKALETPSDHHVLAAAALDGMLSESGPKIRETAVLYSRPGQPAPLRQAAIGALARLAKDDPQVATVLTDLAGDKHRNVRRAVWMALLRNDVKSAVPALEAQLKRETTTARPMLEMAISSLKSAGPRSSVATGSSPAAASDSKAEVATMERQAADLELQAKELRNKAEALKLKDERAKLGAAKTGS